MQTAVPRIVEAVNAPMGFGGGSRRSRRAAVLLVCAAMVVLGLLVAFAIALANNQSSSKASIEARVHDRAVISAALVDSIFSSATQQVPTLEKELGGRVVSSKLLNADVGNSEYLVVLGPNGRPLAASKGFTAQAAAELPHSGTLALLTKGDSYALGNMMALGKSQVMDLAVPLKTAYGNRTLVEGFAPAVLASLFGGELDRIPGVAGAHNYILDGNDTIIATNNVKARPVGYRFTSAAARAALAKRSGERDGRYYDLERLTNSTWKLVLSSPSAELFASINGIHRWVPWLLLIAFALVGAIALGLGWRLLHSAEQELATANTELASVNARLAATNAQLERRANELARSNAELDQFASIASHDLQEPLRKVRTFTQQLSETESEHLSERGADYLMRANRAAERMQGLIQDLLQFSRVTTKPRPFTQVDLSAVLADVIDDVSVELEEHGTKLEVDPLPTISADPLQMRQLFQNLISNAIKFQRDGVTPEVKVRGEQVGDQVRITFKDNGIGFEPQYATRIFRVFERLNGRNEYPGTGIGLALCQKIVTRHRGVITADGELGVGATFTVTLPLHQPAEPEENVEGTDPVSEPDKERAHVTT